MTAAAFRATIHGFKTVPTRKVIQVTVEVSIEEQAHVAKVATHGAWVVVFRPNPEKSEEEKTCPVCRTTYPLDLGECPECSTPTREDVSDVSNVADVTATAASDDSSVPARRFVLSQLAWLLCQKPTFRAFLMEEKGMRPDENPATWLRKHCGVNTRGNILPGTPAAEKFYKIDSEFTAWERVAA